MYIHLALLVVSLAFLPIAPNADFWKPEGDEMPIGRILLLLAATIGLPYFMLSTTGPLLQESYRRETGHPPYRLYSLSNVGSLLALLSYPFVFEPELTLKTQIWGWSTSYVVFAAFCAWCALAFVKPAVHGVTVPDAAPAQLEPGRGTPDWQDIALWLALAACGSAILLATTNQLCQEITAVPFLWVLPLALYLLTFIICFDHERWYNRHLFLVLLALGVLGACFALHMGTGLELWKQVSIYSSTMWICCMVCHGELVRARPAAHYATLFYLMVSAGGVIGGLLVAVVAPLLLHDFWEYQITLVATIALAFWATVRHRDETVPRPRTQAVTAGSIVIGLGLTLGWLVAANRPEPDDVEWNLETTRNFYGVLRVNHEDDPENVNGPRNELIHGRIQHGFQYTDADKRRWPTTYYGAPSGVGKAIDFHPRRDTGEPMRIGVIGLGCGTLACYGREQDTVRFYEINPQVIRISDQYFSFRKDCPAQVDVVLGDARIKMEREVADGNHQRFDVLAVDAFSSDAIPMHLLTLECGKLFFEELKPDGILCLHISNRFLDLTPVTRGLAEALGVECALFVSTYDRSLGLNRTSWVLLTNNKEFLERPEVSEDIVAWEENSAEPILWTDDYASLWKALATD